MLTKPHTSGTWGFMNRDRVTDIDGLKVYTVDHIGGSGLTMQIDGDEDAWLSMKDALWLREWV